MISAGYFLAGFMLGGSAFAYAAWLAVLNEWKARRRIEKRLAALESIKPEWTNVQLITYNKLIKEQMN